MTLSRAAVILISIAFALDRLLGDKIEAFQAFAHLWVGGLIGVWWALHGVGFAASFSDPIWTPLPTYWWDRFDRVSRLAGWLAVALSVVEVYAAPT